MKFKLLPVLFFFSCSFRLCIEIGAKAYIFSHFFLLFFSNNEHSHPFHCSFACYHCWFSSVHFPTYEALCLSSKPLYLHFDSSKCLANYATCFTSSVVSLRPALSSHSFLGSDLLGWRCSFSPARFRSCFCFGSTFSSDIVNFAYLWNSIFCTFVFYYEWCINFCCVH